MNETEVGHTYILLLFAASLALAYELRFTAAMRHIARTLSGIDSHTDFQDAITPPASPYLRFAIYLISLAVVALGFYRYGFLKGIGASGVFLAFVMLNRLFLLPKPESQHFHNMVVRSLVRRYANCLREGNKVQAAEMAVLLHRAGIPAEELATGRH